VFGQRERPANLAVVVPVPNCLRHENYKSTLGRYHWSCFVGYAFVGVTNTILQAKSNNNTEGNVALRMQQALNSYEGGIQATGDQLPEVLIGTLSILGGSRLRAEGQNGCELVRDGDGNVAAQQERYRSPTPALAKLAPDGNDQARFQSSGHLSRRCLGSMTDLTYSTLYPLRATLARRQCDIIMTPILQAGLSCSGMHGPFPRGVRSHQNCQGSAISSGDFAYRTVVK
jgi:hypothetical protein